MELLAHGGSLAVSAEEEASLYVVLEAAMGVLSRAGVAVRMSGTPKIDPYVAFLSEPGVQLIIPGPVAPPLELMPPPQPGQVCVVARQPHQWRSLRVQPDLMWPSLLDTPSGQIAAAHLLRGGSRLERAALIVGALDCDLPDCLLRGATPPSWLAPVFVPSPGRRTTWLAIRGAWQIREEVMRWCRENPEEGADLLQDVDTGLSPSNEAMDSWRTRLKLAAKAAKIVLA
jgi:hypothetical protein